jgi:polyferredoxin
MIKKIKNYLISCAVTILVVYVGFGTYVYLIENIPDKSIVDIFNPIDLFYTLLFIFGWGLGDFGFVLLFVLFIGLVYIIEKLLRGLNIIN